MPLHMSENLGARRLLRSDAAAAAAAKSLQSCLTLCDPIDGSPPGSSVPGILWARTLEWVAISFSNACMHAKSLQSCLTLCGPIDSSPPGSSVPGILWARTLEWVAISFSNFLLLEYVIVSLSSIFDCAGVSVSLIDCPSTWNLICPINKSCHSQ